MLQNSGYLRIGPEDLFPRSENPNLYFLCLDSGFILPWGKKGPLPAIFTFLNIFCSSLWFSLLFSDYFLVFFLGRAFQFQIKSSHSSFSRFPWYTVTSTFFLFSPRVVLRFCFLTVCFLLLFRYFTLASLQFFLCTSASSQFLAVTLL